MKNNYCCNACIGRSKGCAPISTKRGTGLYVRPIYGSGSPLLLGVAPTARPPFLGKEQLDTQAFYGVGRGAGNSMTSRSLGEVPSTLENKLKNLTLKPVKSLRKNIKINF